MQIMYLFVQIVVILQFNYSNYAVQLWKSCNWIMQKYNSINANYAIQLCKLCNSIMQIIRLP